MNLCPVHHPIGTAFPVTMSSIWYYTPNTILHNILVLGYSNSHLPCWFCTFCVCLVFYFFFYLNHSQRSMWSSGSPACCHSSAYSWAKSFHIHMANLSKCHKEEIITFSLKSNKAHQSCVLCIIVNIVTSNQFILLVKTVFSWQVKDLWKQYICACYLSTHRHKEAEYIRNKKYVSLYNGPIVCSTREGLCHNIWCWMCFSCSPAFIIKYLMQIL